LLSSWLQGQLPGATGVEISEMSIPEGTGMSSETLLFDASWTIGADTTTGSYVARLRPDMGDYPVFPEYDLELQYKSMRLVEAHSDVPVPETPFVELDPKPLGAPFFVMRRSAGAAPTDMPPYVFGGWIAEATEAQRRTLEVNAIDVLARLHAIDVTGPDAAFLDRPQYGATPLEQHLGYQRWYYDWAREGESYGLIDSCFDWLDARRPDVDPVHLTWGDARIGNILWDDFRPTAVLDWEMAALGAREVDLAWMIFLHRFFQNMAERFGMPGIPGFMDRARLVGLYEAATGHTVRDLEFYEMFAAMRFAIISLRTSLRSISYGEMDEPDDPTDLIMHRGLIEQMLDGSFWS